MSDIEAGVELSRLAENVKRDGMFLLLLACAIAVASFTGLHWGFATLLFVGVAGFVIARPDAHGEPRGERDVVSASSASATAEVWQQAAAAYDAVDMPIYLLDARENIVFQNLTARKTFGEFPNGNHVSLRFRSPAILDMLRDVLANGMANGVEFSERAPSMRVFAVQASELELEQALPQEKKFLVLSFREISEGRQIDRMRSDFVANASHELRTPLASLTGFIETLQGPARDDPKALAQFLGIMADQTARMNRLVDDLLSLSRLEVKAHVPPSEDVELGALMEQVIDGVKSMANDLQVDINFARPEVPVVVRGDRVELVQVFENLLQNACKYGQEGNKVDVTLSAPNANNGAELSIRDYGPGIAKEHIPRLTERFYRVNVEASRSKKGTGLGLAIVKHILTRHRARLVIESEVGKGSTFIVRF